MRASTKTLLPALAGTRNTYVWRVPLEGSLPRDFAAIVGGQIGPVALDASWGLTSLLEASPGLGSAGVRRLLLAAGDPRDARALAAMAEVAATIPGLEAPEDACRFVAGSLGPSRTTDDEPGNVPAVPFDVRPDRLRRGRAGAGSSAARRSPRVAASWRSARQAEASRPTRPPWRAPSRGPPAAWSCASSRPTSWRGRGAQPKGWFQTFGVGHARNTTSSSRTSSTPSAPGARLTPPASGNAYLIRCLTNEWLRMLDAHPDVPLVATANDEDACDRAVLRRFTMVVPVSDRLSPAQERLAWESVLRSEPPEGWRPVGAAVGDFAAALARCRLLGRDDAASLGQAIEAARRARLGPEARHIRQRRRPLH